MALLDASLRNPHAVVAALTLVLVFGLMSLLEFPIQLLPDIDRPQLSVSTHWRTASSREVESEVIEPQEDVLSGLPGLVSMRSNAFNADGFVNLEFEFGTDMQETLVEVISRLNRVQGFPDDAEPPVVEIGFNNTTGTGKALSWFYIQIAPGNDEPIEKYIPLVEDVIRPKLESVPGVASVYMSAGEVDELRVQFEPFLAAELGITIGQIAEHVGAATDVSAGFANVGRREYTLRFAGRQTPAELGSLILDWRLGRPVFLRDVAEISVSRSDRRSFVYQNGNSGIGLRVDRQPGANVLEALNRVKAVFAELDETVLARNGLRVEQSFDPSVYIYRAIGLVTNNIVLGALLTLGVLWWFLRRLRATIIIALAIPVSLMATFVVLQLSGRNLNVISLAGIAFAVGMVVDAAIVVLENILRMKTTNPPVEAASLGTRQVLGALIASTVTTIAIFLPVIFIEDVEGQMFTDLALTISIAVGASLLVATLVLPALATRYLGNIELVDQHANTWRRIADRVIKITDGNLKRRFLVGGLIIIPLSLTWLLMPSLDYLPPVKRDLIESFLNFPPGRTIESIDNTIAKPLIERMQPYYEGEKSPKLKNYYIFVNGPWGANVGARPEDPDDIELVNQLIRNEVVVGLPDVSVFVQQGNLFGDFEGSRQVLLHMQARDRSALAEAVRTIQDAITSQLPDTNIRIEPPLQMSQPELRLSPRHRALAEAGWTNLGLSRAIRAVGSGLYIGEYFDGDVRMDIMVRAKPWQTPEELASWPMATPSGEVFHLGQLAEIERKVGPSQVARLDGRRTIDMSIAVPDKVSLQQYIQIIRDIVEPLADRVMPIDGSVRFGGSASQLDKAILSMAKNFGLALFILGVIMAALFRSIRDSLLVLLAIPLATVGSVALIRLIDLVSFQPMDLLTMIGFVILLGLVVNNAILLVHQTRSAERLGAPRREAVRQAIEVRCRPILMSTLTSIFGMLPLLLMPGAGSIVYRGLAAAIVGGMAVSTIFTLILLPALLRMGKPNEEEQNNMTPSAYAGGTT
ncbi:MAG: MMPL family transporter [Pseudomonadales bacterium]|nr:MMPL family transporter [Pseudomonadales bacterium]